jgi:hypothetical protein
MKAKAWKILCFLALGLALAGCSSWGNPLNSAYQMPFSNPFSKQSGPPPEPNVMPTNFRTNLLNFLEKELVDPSGVRDAYVSEPTLQPFGTESRYAACVRYNAKNGYGEYTGSIDYVAIYFNGSLSQFVPASPGQCANAAYVRWPELERLKKPGT